MVTQQPGAWHGFTDGPWQTGVDVADFVRRNRTPYDGGAAFLTGPTTRTETVWNKVSALFPVERKRGIYDVDTSTPAGITAFAPGYIDADNELIVGLQTDAPLKRAIMPNGGFRMVEAGLKAYGYDVDPLVKKIFTRYRRTHNDGGLRRLHRADACRPRRRPHHRAARRLRPRPDHRRLPSSGAVRGGPADRRQARRTAPDSMTCRRRTT